MSGQVGDYKSSRDFGLTVQSAPLSKAPGLCSSRYAKCKVQLSVLELRRCQLSSEIGRPSSGETSI
jgi:hypothetical protein